MFSLQITVLLPAAASAALSLAQTANMPDVPDCVGRAVLLFLLSIL